MTASRLTPRVAALGTLIADRYGRGSNEHRMCSQLSDALPRVISVLRADTPDGYPTSTPGARDRDGGRSTSLDTLGNLVARRERTTSTYSLLCAAVAEASASLACSDRPGVRRALSDALRVADGCQVIIDTKAITKSQRCFSPASEHLEPWYRADCENVASPGRQGRCDACSMRRHRWIKANEEGAA
jgi:hypothetical protein